MNGAEIRKVLEGLELSQTDAARRLGVTQQAVSLWVRGDAEPTELVVHILRCPTCRKHFLGDAALTHSTG